MRSSTDIRGEGLVLDVFQQYAMGVAKTPELNNQSERPHNFGYLVCNFMKCTGMNRLWFNYV